MSIDFNDLGNRQKKFENAQAKHHLMPGIPTLARVDGRAFHTFTKGLVRPFDSRLGVCMTQTAVALLDEFKADLAYTQSDEITLCWKNLDEDNNYLMFSGKFHKMISLVAAQATWNFGRAALSSLPYYYMERPALFDCRVWQVPNLRVAAENFLWREMDATKNSVSMAASAYYPESQLNGKSTRERKNMLLEKGIFWEEYPIQFKRGAYFKKVKEPKLLTEEELTMIKPEHRPTSPVLRSVIKRMDWPRATAILNLPEVLFEDERPEIYKEIVNVPT